MAQITTLDSARDSAAAASRDGSRDSGHQAVTAKLASMTFVEVQSLALACQQRMGELKETGVRELVDRFERQAAEAFGVSVDELVRAARKKRGPGRPRKAKPETLS